jgi:hypothetical protein
LLRAHPRTQKRLISTQFVVMASALLQRICVALTARVMATIKKCGHLEVNKMRFYILILIILGCANPDINVDVSPTITSSTSSTSSSEAINENESNRTQMRDKNSDKQHAHCDGCREHCLKD